MTSPHLKTLAERYNRQTRAVLSPPVQPTGDEAYLFTLSPEGLPENVFEVDLSQVEENTRQARKNKLRGS